tara:strand:+ start:292 stop:1335 length:1044 start_codon:yes stop_codon:yes gene_type:complete
LLILRDNFNSIKEEWITSNFFISEKFIQCFVRNNKSLTHLFIKQNNNLIYSQCFNIYLEKSSNYLNNNMIAKILFNLFKIKTFYLTNSFFTNVSSFDINSKINIESLLKKINNQMDYFLLVVPDFLFEKLDTNKNNGFTKVEIEEEMLIKEVSKWKTIDEYKFSLKTKYRKKIKDIESKSKSIEVSEFKRKDIEKYKKQIQKLFDQVLEKSKFNGPRFNTDTLLDMQKNKICKLYGYYIKSKLIGFSSEIKFNNKLFSYYVGFDKQLNKEFSIYGRMLLETIKNGINQKCDEIVFGRTANEYKSNFGAIPKKSFIYIRSKSKISNFIMSFIFKKINKSSWIQRRPFK